MLDGSTRICSIQRTRLRLGRNVEFRVKESLQSGKLPKRLRAFTQPHMAKHDQAVRILPAWVVRQQPKRVCESRG